MSELKAVKMSELCGKTITKVDASCVNTVRLECQDGTVFELEGLSVGPLNIPALVLSRETNES